jgi:hypothetical protein
MGHTQPKDLKDLQPILDQIRTWEHLKEKSPNIFYFKSKPFLHFHDKNGKRWADVRDGETWGKEIAIPFDCAAAQSRSFLDEVRRRYQGLLVAKK